MSETQHQYADLTCPVSKFGTGSDGRIQFPLGRIPTRPGRSTVRRHGMSFRGHDDPQPPPRRHFSSG